MFSLLNGIYDSYFAPVQLNVLVVGGHGSGKTALLERLRVTDIPTRPKNGAGSKAMSQRMAAEELTENLMTAFAETGAVHIRRKLEDRLDEERQCGRGSSFSSSSDAVDTERQDQSAAATAQTRAISTSKTKGTMTVTVTQKTKKRFNFCPAPERYLKATHEQDDDEEITGGDDENSLVHSDSQNKSNGLGSGTGTRWEHEIMNELNEQSQQQQQAPQRVRCHSKELDMDCMYLMDENEDGRRSSMQDIPLDQPLTTSAISSLSRSPQQQARRRKSNDGDTGETLAQAAAQQISPPSSRRPQSLLLQRNQDNPPLHQNSSEVYGTKPKVVMLPLRLIRPTIGTNLKKIDMYGAQCHCFDVGGKLQDLWERYYDDCDAVIFCWRLGDDPDGDTAAAAASNDDDSNHDRDDEFDPSELYKKQQTILNQVRKSIPDEVPFLVFGHVMGNANVAITDRMFSTDLLMPHYHNPMTSMCCGSAKTGAGVQSAMDWLIPLAKRQQKERQQERRHIEEKQL